jgi:hypothetical protein
MQLAANRHAKISTLYKQFIKHKMIAWKTLCEISFPWLRSGGLLARIHPTIYPPYGRKHFAPIEGLLVEHFKLGD